MTGRQQARPMFKVSFLFYPFGLPCSSDGFHIHHVVEMLASVIDQERDPIALTQKLKFSCSD